MPGLRSRHSCFTTSSPGQADRYCARLRKQLPGRLATGGWWKDAFSKYQPGITIEYDLETAADAIPCLYLGKADIGVTHEPSFYDYLSYQRLKGNAPTGITILTGSYDVVGWQNNMVIVVNKANPLTKISMTQLDGIFGAQRA